MFKPYSSVFVLLTCVACGSSFEPGGSGGTSGSDGGASQAGTTSGGDTSNGASAGESSGGANSAGDTSSGGQTTAGSGGSAHAGAASGGTSSAGAASGGSAAADCAALKAEYAALVKKARVCSEGSTDQCSTTSQAPNVGGCGCPTLVNAKSEYTAQAAAKYEAIQKNKCAGGLTCGVACLPPTSASCAQTSGMGTSEFVCTGNSGIAN